MKVTDLKLNINKTLLKKAREKAQKEFCMEKCKKTELFIIVMLLALYKKCPTKLVLNAVSTALDKPSEIEESNYENKTIQIIDLLLDTLQEQWGEQTKTASDIANTALALYITTPLDKYLSRIGTLYTIVGSKNQTMQNAVADAVKNMQLNPSDMVLVDACCATGALFWGLDNYPWMGVILNDLNPLRTNFLNVLLKKPLHLIKAILNAGINQSLYPAIRSANLKKYKDAIENFKENSNGKVECDVDIACYTFLIQCLNKEYIETDKKILQKLSRMLRAHLKMLHSNVKITQRNAMEYLAPILKVNINHQKMTITNNRLVLFDPPYVGSEYACKIDDFDYLQFHKKVAEHLQNAEYPFLYHARSSAPKSDTTFNKEEWENIIKNRLAKYFFKKAFYIEKIFLDKDTEVIISKTCYAPQTQFLWHNDGQDILHK